MRRRRSVTVLAIPLFGSISARVFITSSDRSGTGKAPRAASFVRKKLAPAASGAPCLASDNLGSTYSFQLRAEPRLTDGACWPFGAFPRNFQSRAGHGSFDPNQASSVLLPSTMYFPRAERSLIEVQGAVP